jgi:prepilin-type N-terminal cleavage/methylation domain-containing protein
MVRSLARARARGERGFTLVEMLVTLAIVAMISGLLWQAMQQTFQVERLLQGSGTERQMQVVRREWVRSLLEAALPDRLGAAEQFHGNGGEVTLTSAEMPDLAGFNAGWMRLAFERDARTGEHRLLARSISTKAERDAWQDRALSEATLLQWSGRAPRFRYLDAQGEWHDAWPVPGAPVQRLPKAVMLDLGDEVGGSLIARMGATEPSRERRSDWEKRF